MRNVARSNHSALVAPTAKTMTPPTPSPMTWLTCSDRLFRPIARVKSLRSSNRSVSRIRIDVTAGPPASSRTNSSVSNHASDHPPATATMMTPTSAARTTLAAISTLR